MSEKFLEITKEQAQEIFDMKEPEGLFWYKDGNKFIAIDNSSGEVWQEEFDSKEDCFLYLEEYDYDVICKGLCLDCETEKAKYIYDGKRLCPQCLLSKLAQDHKINSWTVTNYMFNDCAIIGNTNDNEIEEMSDKVAKHLNIKAYKNRGVL